ncbi:MAG: ribonuclease III [Candidatus Woesebacteria bacterium]
MLPTFIRQDLLSTALTHRSALNESTATESNERLEFLGDAVLELVTTEFLYAKFPSEPEGMLTSYRAALVKTTTLAVVAKELGLDQLLKISKGEERSGGRDNVGLLADTFEAFTGALYLDQGYEAAKVFISTNLLPKVDQVVTQKLYKDYKTSLQEQVQSQGQGTPIYETIEESGPDHLKVFTVQVLVDQNILGAGTGRNKQDASQEAARAALEKMKDL